MKKIIYKIFTKAIKLEGKSPNFASSLINDIKKDFVYNKENNIMQKLWAYKRGFFSNKIQLYNLNEKNYHKYLSDFEYHSLYPINGKASNWINDKLTLKYILNPFDDYLPKYYYQINNGKVLKLMDCKSEFSDDVYGLINLLKQEKHIAIKLIAGSLGNGFYKISYINNEFYKNEDMISENELIDFITSLKNHVAIEYINAHNRIRQIFDKTPNAIRIMTIKDENYENHIVAAFIRFGTKKTGFIEHGQVGGIFATIDIDSGKFSNAKILKNGQGVNLTYHPDTGQILEGYIPNWSLVKDEIQKMCDYIRQVKYMGWDIAITDDGFKVLEINSHQLLNGIQMYNPLYENEHSCKFFKQLLEENKSQL